MPTNAEEVNGLMAAIATVCGVDGYLPLSVRHKAALAAWRVVADWRDHDPAPSDEAARLIADERYRFVGREVNPRNVTPRRLRAWATWADDNAETFEKLRDELEAMADAWERTKRDDPAPSDEPLAQPEEG